MSMGKFLSLSMSNAQYSQHLQSELRDHLALDAALRHRNNWEIRTDQIVKENIVNGRVKTLQSQAQERLEDRRQRLRDLLDSEDEAYKLEMEAREETSEDRKQEMMERVQTLRRKRQRERNDYLQKAEEKRFRHSTDEIRADNIRFNALECQVEQGLQIKEKQRRKEVQKQHDLLYDEMWKRNQKRKDQRERQDKESKMRLLAQTNEILGWQRDRRMQTEQKNRMAQSMENAELRATFQKLHEDDKGLNRDRKLLQKQANDELLEANRQMLEEKQQQLQEELRKDKEMIKEVEEREAALTNMENELRVAKQQQAERARQDQERKKKRSQEYENYYDSFLEKEALKKKQDQDREWQARRDRTENLMRNVYQSRANDIVQKRKMRATSLDQAKIERDALDREISRLEQMDKERKNQERLRQKQYQEDLKFQMEQKKLQAMKGAQNEMYETKAAQLMEKSYQGRIKAEHNRRNQILKQFKNQRIIF